VVVVGEPATSIVGWAAVVGFVIMAGWIHSLSEYKGRFERRAVTLAELTLLRDGLTRPADYPGGLPEGSYLVQQETAQALDAFGAHPAVVIAAGSGDWKTVNRILSSHIKPQDDEET
jgi:hypothetical protein